MAAKKTPVPEAEPDKDTLAHAIVQISEAMQKLTASGLNKRAVTILLKHETGLSLQVIANVLNALSDLADKYTK